MSSFYSIHIGKYLCKHYKKKKNISIETITKLFNKTKHKINECMNGIGLNNKHFIKTIRKPAFPTTDVPGVKLTRQKYNG